jgi:hypothetical protein
LKNPSFQCVELNLLLLFIIKKFVGLFFLRLNLFCEWIYFVTLQRPFLVIYNFNNVSFKTVRNRPHELCIHFD